MKPCPLVLAASVLAVGAAFADQTIDPGFKYLPSPRYQDLPFAPAPLQETQAPDIVLRGITPTHPHCGPSYTLVMTIGNQVFCAVTSTLKKAN